MVEKTTVTLDHSELQDAIADYLKSKGYTAKTVTFEHDVAERKVIGAEVVVIKTA